MAFADSSRPRDRRPFAGCVATAIACVLLVFAATPAKRYVRPEKEPDQLGAKAWGWLGSRLFGARQPSK
jgi:hypothetical protein